MTDQLAAIIDAAWDARDAVSTGDAAAKSAMRSRQRSRALDSGEARVAEKIDGAWQVNQWLKKAVLLSFRLQPDGRDPRRPGRRAVVGQGAVEIPRLGRGAISPRPASARCPARSSAAAPIIAPGAVLMPSFVNIGAYVGEGTMVDTWATVGSCAQIGRNVHISGGTGIGGVLEPLQAGPGDHRGRLLHRRALRSRRGRDRRAGRGDLDGRVPRRLDQDRRPRDRRGDLRPRAGLFGGRPRHACRGKDGGPASPAR